MAAGALLLGVLGGASTAIRATERFLQDAPVVAFPWHSADAGEKVGVRTTPSQEVRT